MLIVCPDCDTSYQVDAASLGESGRSVRCARCQTEWFADAPRALAVVESASPHDSASVCEEAPIRHEEWWTGNGAGETELEPSPAAGEWAIAEAPAETAEFSRQGLPPIDTIIIEIAAEAPPLVPVVDNTKNGSPADDLRQDAAIDVETVAARGAKLAVAPRPPRKRRGPGPALAAVILLAVVGGLIAGRTQIVRHAPQTGALYKAVGLPVNLRGLNFKDVRITGENEDDVPVLVVQGTIVNAVDRPVEVPRMRFSLLTPSGVETYAWTALPGRTVLGEGETVSFRSRLASPPPNVRDVQVRFFNRRDREAGR